MTTLERLRLAKSTESYHSLSLRLGIPINTLRTWLKYGKIGNKIYEIYVGERLSSPSTPSH